MEVEELVLKKVKKKPRAKSLEKVPQKSIVDIENWAIEDYKKSMRNIRNFFIGVQLFFQLFVVCNDPILFFEENPQLFLFQQFLIVFFALFIIWVYCYFGKAFPWDVKKYRLDTIHSAKLQYPEEERAFEHISHRYAFKELFPEKHKRDPYDYSYGNAFYY